MVKNIAASVKQRLLNLAKDRNEDFNYVLMRYVIERFLYRLSVSKYADTFLLKGGTLFTVWHDKPHRPTKDIDLLGFCKAELDEIKEIILEVLSDEYEDGLVFDIESMVVAEIREDNKYDGIRVMFLGYLEKAKANVQIDIGFGDAVTPGPEDVHVPALLDFPEPKLKAYPVYTVVAEKYEAMCNLGEANSRMKDFYDIWYIATTNNNLDMDKLKLAVETTFKRRGTELVKAPVIFQNDFIEDEDRQARWKSFLRKNRLSLMEFRDAINAIKSLIDKIT
tara:strand:+ start:21 stop:857 length:837 start_codon:yes stop_codon:yes gene_type:complete